MSRTLLAGVALFIPMAGGALADTGVPRVLARSNAVGMAAPAARGPVRRPVSTDGFLPTWQYSLHRGDNDQSGGTTFTETFIGKNPKTGKSITAPTYIIPIALTYGSFTTDPTMVGQGGQSPVTATVNSPIFQDVDYVQGGVDVGTTQYEDAVQRAAFWSIVQGKPGYHVLLGSPSIKKITSITVPQNEGSVAVEFGVKALLVDVSFFDTQIERLLTSLKIPTKSLPIFITTQTYLTSGGCCIGGYHNYTGKYSYVYFTFIQDGGNGAFAEDVAALSAQAGNWLTDPFVNNNSPCGLYEIGDPLQGGANFGTYPYTLNGFTYHLQDLVLPPYFGAPQNTSVNGQFTFQGTNLTVCQNGP